MYTSKIVLITGASRGVGFDLANHFLQNNATVIGISRGASNISHANYHHFSVDIGKPEEITGCFKKEISRKFPQLDIVINNAAVLTSQYAMIMPPSNAMDMMNINLMGTFFVSREAVKLMRKSKAGRIINISSMAVNLMPAGDSVYAATKAGVHMLANVMAKEFSVYNVTCNTLAITAYDTDMLQSHNDTAKEKIKAIINSLPIPRMAKLEDITNAVDFFSSDKSGYITAQVLNLGGIS